MNAPKLRFKKDKSEYRVEKLNDLVEVIDCQHSTAPVTKEETIYKMIRTSNVRNGQLLVGTMDSVDEETYHKWSIRGYVIPEDIILTREAPMGEVAIVPKNIPEKLFLGQRCLQLKATDKVIPYYMYLLLQGPTFARHIRPLKAGGSTVSNIRIPELKNFKFKIPDIMEQNKISDFFYGLNLKIQKQQEKVELLKEQKKGLMQKIFSRELRFKDEDGKEFPKWDVRKLREIVNPLKGNSLGSLENNNIPVLSISARSGFLNQVDRFSEVIAGNSLKKYTQINKHDLSYNKGNSKLAKYGCVYMLKEHQTALVPNVYKSFRVKPKINPLYIQFYFHSKIPDKELRKIITSTARMDGLLNVSDQDFYSIPIQLPAFEEQTKIANLIESLDRKIDIEETKYQVMIEQKKGFMQQMFV